jgi:hypothetical protein
MARLLHESRQPDWRDSKGAEHGNTFWMDSFLKKKLKRAKIQQKIDSAVCPTAHAPTLGGSARHSLMWEKSGGAKLGCTRSVGLIVGPNPGDLTSPFQTAWLDVKAHAEPKPA